MGKTNAITQKERAYIRANFADMTLSEIALALGRSYEAVRNHAVAMRLHKAHRWSAQEDAVLMGLWGRYPAEHIARVIGVDTNCVYNRIRRLRKNRRMGFR